MTKTELEQELTGAKAIIGKQRQAINMLSREVGMEVTLPWAAHMTKDNAACYISGSRKTFSTAITPIVEKAIREHGIAVRAAGGGIESASAINLGEGRTRSPDVYLIPRTVGLMLIDLMDGAATISQAAYKAGYLDGSDLLSRLRNSEISVDDFEGSIDQKKAAEMQSHKMFSTEQELSFRKV